MLLINCKIELNIKWTKHCVLDVDGTDKINCNRDSIIFNVIFYLVFIILSLTVKDAQRLSKFLSKGFERSVYWNEYKRESENKNTTNEYRYFLESNFVGVNSSFVLIH